MKKKWNIKYVVKDIYITKPLQKIHFTVRHPENALYLSGISVDTNYVAGPVRDGQIFKSAAGILSLAIPEMGDVFYNTLVKTEVPNYAKYIRRELSTNSLKPLLNASRERNIYLDTCVQITGAMIEGFYEDTANNLKVAFLYDGLPKPEPIGIPVPRPFKNLYKVTLYLRYQMKEEKQTV